ncbi:hypothetical protein [Conexibacter sp. SYSU D00693]|uniref:hypothetical protein n=1 Tax=Conexibacter sp. SYSU D00693 TaxID=2812560 RepID=UPI00196AB410|nr:hypothetical protein [Conexibacter sp. SYSU D00693]
MGKRARRQRDPEELRAARAARVAAQPAGPARTSRLDNTRLGQRAAGRPKAPWHPIPVSEIAIAGGLLLFILGFAQGGTDQGGTWLGAGTLLATAGVIELCAREHFTGYRSHVLLLAFLPVVAMHTTIALWIDDDFRGPQSVLVDAAVFGVLALLLLDRYRKAAKRRQGTTS